MYGAAEQEERMISVWSDLKLGHLFERNKFWLFEKAA